MNFGGLKILPKGGIITGLPQITTLDQPCEECATWKHGQIQFPKGNAWRAQEKLGQIHTDIIGPRTPTSSRGKRYFISVGY